jgi:very-short-patch-repair endonuclease
MGTTTKENIKKLQIKAMKRFLPFAEKLREEGRSDGEIIGEFNKFKNIEIKKFYRGKNPIGISPVIKEALLMAKEADSRIEAKFYILIEKENIPFQFHYKIGPYVADFLIEGFLVFEIDGPQHNLESQKEHDERRDKFMKEFGYQVMRVPSWLLAMEPNAVIEEIKRVLVEA